MFIRACQTPGFFEKPGVSTRLLRRNSGGTRRRTGVLGAPEKYVLMEVTAWPRQQHTPDSHRQAPRREHLSQATRLSLSEQGPVAFRPSLTRGLAWTESVSLLIMLFYKYHDAIDYKIITYFYKQNLCHIQKLQENRRMAVTDMPCLFTSIAMYFFEHIAQRTI